MIKSMTGFGQAIANYDDVTVTIEVKSLNSKFLDLSMRLPKKFSDKENEVRTLVADMLERGKVTVNMDYQKKASVADAQRYDENLFATNYAELKKLADKVMADYDPLFQLALDAPGVKQTEVAEQADPAEWEKIVAALKTAIDSCNNFRDLEGKALGAKLENYIANIGSGLQHVIKLEPARTEKIKNKLKENLATTFSNENADANRLEQEMIYYIEKLDVQEECVRLSTHLSYFTSVMKEKTSNGKKLGFISQEIGREINTIGSKANDAALQKYVVEMKDELEKIKEQLNNVI
ncbi:MAG TPA: YicC/YloC family endoribonuclease [Cyclobacteriaceae bacterium]|nr:YicC/YloC family endoribonuclease [Cyclobacteriaceae bacterium]